MTTSASATAAADHLERAQALLRTEDLSPERRFEAVQQIRHALHSLGVDIDQLNVMHIDDPERPDGIDRLNS